ncbi:MAG: hypothetical protein ACKPKO_02405, partial [Candidatus Fonsibacter sp.]
TLNICKQDSFNDNIHVSQTSEDTSRRPMTSIRSTTWHTKTPPAIRSASKLDRYCSRRASLTNQGRRLYVDYGARSRSKYST